MTPPATLRARAAGAGRGQAANGRSQAAGAGRAAGAGGAALSVLDRKALVERLRARRARVLVALAGLLVAGALGVVAGGQGVVASEQLHLDQLDQQLATAVARTQALQVQRAELASPSRVLDIAEHQLHMVEPGQVTYLTPVGRPSHPLTSASSPHRARS